MCEDYDITVDLVDPPLEIEVDIPEIVVITGPGGSIVIKNSDNTFNVTASTSPYVLEDTNIKVYVNGVLKQSVVRPSMVSQNINITPAP